MAPLTRWLWLGCLGAGLASAQAAEWEAETWRLVETFSPGAEWTTYANFIGGFRGDLGDDWSYEAIGRFDGYWEERTDGPRAGGLGDTRFDAQSALLKWSGSDARFSIGYGIVRWGKTDEVSPVDRVAAEDQSRIFLDTLKERRRAVPLVRLEYFADDWTLDLVGRPIFRPAEMPDFDSIWSVVDRQRGRVVGFEEDPQLADLLERAEFTEDDDGDGGWAARLSGRARNFDWGVSLQRQRRSIPYYRLTARPDGQPLFVAEYPRRWIVGGELSAAVGMLTVRAEAAYLSDEPATRERDFAYVTVPAWEAVAGIDWWPGDADTLVVVQLAGRYLDDGGDDLLDRTAFLALNGSVRRPWGRGDWEGEVRYLVGLNEPELYLNPKVTWKRFTPHQFIFGAQIFAGSEITQGGFYDDYDLVSFEWRVDF